MHCFLYDSRVIENEQQVRLERNVRRIGNLLHAVVNFFVTFFLFILINFLLSNLVRHTNLTFVSMLRFVQESAEVMVSQSALSAVCIAYQHSLCIVLAFAFTCVYYIGLLLNSLCNGEVSTEKEHSTHSKDSGEFSANTGVSAVSYRDKVCFLS